MDIKSRSVSTIHDPYQLENIVYKFWLVILRKIILKLDHFPYVSAYNSVDKIINMNIMKTLYISPCITFSITALLADDKELGYT